MIMKSNVLIKTMSMNEMHYIELNNIWAAHQQL
jgi:hypothetical protein